MDHLYKIIGKYKLTSFIGEGGMASVYEGTHEKLGTKVAVKILNPVLTANRQIRLRFENEAKFMASLNHKNITQVLDYDEQPDLLAIVMELIWGQDLSTLIKTRGALTPEQAIPIFTQVLDAFQYAHSKGIVHRDIKPSNIFLTEENQVKILDFGIAKIVGSGDDLTSTGTQIGTPVYMSPEQVKGEKNIDQRSDIYSLGITLFFTLNGKAPYDSTTQSNFEIFNKIVYEPIPDLLKYPAYDRVIKQAINKDRNLRFQSAAEFKKSLLEASVAAGKPDDHSRFDKTLIEPAEPLGKPIRLQDEKARVDKPVSESQKPPAKKVENLKKDSPLPVPEKKKPNGSQENTGKKKLLLYGGAGLVILVILLYLFLKNSGPGKAELARMDSIQNAVLIERALTEIRNQIARDSMAAKQRVQDSINSIQNDSINRIRSRYLGDHLFSCYFIGQDEQFGKVNISEGNGIFYLTGKQENKGNSVRIDGTIRIISMRKFEFTGTITAYNKSESNPNCTWEGSTIFWASGSRVYWRTQGQNCFGWTGDMDIYFSRSGT